MTNNRYQANEDDRQEHGYEFTREQIARELARLGDDADD